MGTRRQPESKSAGTGVRLRRLRKDRGLTQSDLARQIGIQQSDLSRMEKGEYRVSLDNLFKILAVFGMGVAEFFEEARPAPAAATNPLTGDDMKVLHMLRDLSPEGRSEVREFIEFKRRRELAEQRAVDQSQDSRGRG